MLHSSVSSPYAVLFQLAVPVAGMSARVKDSNARSTSKLVLII